MRRFPLEAYDRERAKARLIELFESTATVQILELQKDDLTEEQRQKVAELRLRMESTKPLEANG